MAERRRLPLIEDRPPAPSGDDESEVRPPWQWAFFGTVAMFAAWLPLAYVGGAVSAKVMAARFGRDASRDAIDVALAAMTEGERAKLMVTVALPGVLALAVAAFGGGFVVGRFGGGTGAREAAVAGALTAVVALALAWSGASLAALVGSLVTFAVAVGFGAWGGAFGAARRVR